MLTSTLFPLLTIASIAQGLPLDNLDSPLVSRTTGEVVKGPLHVGNAAGSSAGGANPATPTVSAAPDSGTGEWNSNANSTGTDNKALKLASTVIGGAGSSSYKMFTGDGKDWPSQDQWIGDFETMYVFPQPHELLLTFH
jgi:hypothetical protein